MGSDEVSTLQTTAATGESDFDIRHVNTALQREPPT